MGDRGDRLAGTEPGGMTAPKSMLVENRFFLQISPLHRSFPDNFSVELPR